MKKRYTEEQIIGLLKEAEAGLPGKETAGKSGIAVIKLYRRLRTLP